MLTCGRTLTTKEEAVCQTCVANPQSTQDNLVKPISVPSTFPFLKGRLDNIEFVVLLTIPFILPFISNTAFQNSFEVCKRELMYIDVPAGTSASCSVGFLVSGNSNMTGNPAEHDVQTILLGSINFIQQLVYQRIFRYFHCTKSFQHA